MKTSTLLVCLFTFTFLGAQQKFDSSFPFQSDPNKFFSLYIPSGYNNGTPHPMMLAFHPFNTAKWSGLVWRDTLIDFAEENNLILVCPDGGNDGRVDDQLDYDFTLALLDSVKKWYSIDEDKIFVMGFSVGGKATYEFGLAHSEMFSGFIPIGAAINGTTEVTGVISNAFCKPFYLVHGDNDSPNSRYYPIKTALETEKAMVNSILMAGVGHTIDFPNRNKVLKAAYRYVDTVSCIYATGIERISLDSSFYVKPTLISRSGNPFITIEGLPTGVTDLRIISITGKVIKMSKVVSSGEIVTVNLGSLEKGIYLIQVASSGIISSAKIIVQ